MDIFLPFHGGRPLETAELRELLRRVAGPTAELDSDHTAALSGRQVLLRLQNNIKSRALQAGDPATAVAVVERMLLLAPTAVALNYELGMLQIEAGNLKAAIASFDNFLAVSDDPEARAAAQQMMQGLRRRLH